MATAVGVISIIVGIFGSGITLASIAQTEQAQASEEASKTNLRVAVGLDGNGLSNAGGKLDARIFNEFGQSLGAPSVDNECTNGDAACDITIEHDDDHKGQQGTYGLFTGNNDAMCIAYTTITWPDGNKWGWTGDWASTSGDKCNMGQTWYYSNIILQNGTSPYKPSCIWLDANGDQPATAFQVHFPDFYDPNGSLDDERVDSPEDLCGNPSYYVSKGEDPNGITFYDPPRASSYSNQEQESQRRLAKRGKKMKSVKSLQDPSNWKKSGPKVQDPRQRGKFGQQSAPVERRSVNGTEQEEAESVIVDQVKNKMLTPQKEARLVCSSDPGHSAETLCKHPYSYGPNFASEHEKKFCDMHSKKLYGFCKGSSDVDCYEPRTKKVRKAEGRLVRREGPEYTKVIEWQ
ncbi:MAG: hypothetical protein M1831_006167 [Alyxoria varia]|nr:MAG: hypothetical protein M1831_006167 [Alyxoria varia]